MNGATASINGNGACNQVEVGSCYYTAHGSSLYAFLAIVRLERLHQSACRYANEPPEAKRRVFALGLQRIAVDGINPWKAFFFYPAWYKHWRITTQMVYLLGHP